MKHNFLQTQLDLCQSLAATPHECRLSDKVGISMSALQGKMPLNGLRHPLNHGTTGWFLWGGTEFSQDPGFFQPLHAHHLEERCSLSLKYLALPPGWRFLTDGTYEDVWFDESLLHVD